LLAAQGHTIPFLRLIGYRLTAFGISYFTPGPHFGGEPWQVYAVSQRHAVPYAHSIAAVTLDKVVEMLVNFAFLAAGVLFILQQQFMARAPIWTNAAGRVSADTALDAPNWLFLQLIFYVLLLLSIPLGLLLAYRRNRQPISGLLRRIFVRWPGMGKPLTARPWYQTIRQSEIQVSHLCHAQPKTLGGALLISIMSWCAVVWEFWLMTNMLGLELTVVQAMLALIAARLAILLPMPAGIGALEAGQVLVMVGLGLSPAAGIGVTVLIRARDTILALGGLWLGGLGLWALLRGRATAPCIPHSPGALLPTPKPDATTPKQSQV
jgi:glycosyltransferase 2 family protein